ncbi:hypothetical protein V8D89_015019 [Ganoderma adspersum]
MAVPEPGWEQRTLPSGAMNAYTRPLLGSELLIDQTMRLQDGATQFAVGVQFTTSIPEREIEVRLKDATIKLRYECPLVSATIERGIHDPDLGSWVYAPSKSTVHYHPDPVDPASFIQSIVANKLPYILADGSEQYLRVFVMRPNNTLNTFCIFLHASHSLIDAKPGLNAISLLLEWMSTPNLSSVEDLPWGTEHQNLPPGPITATGGPREDWNTNGAALLQKIGAFFGDQTPSHGLVGETTNIKDTRKVQRFHVTFTAQESTRIAQALKSLGFTFSELLDAATALATFEMNPVSEDKFETARVANDVSVVSMTDRLPSTIDRRKHIVSCLVNTPLTIHYAPLVKLSGKARLIAALKQAKEQYDVWLANPCLPHLTAELARIAPPKEVAPSLSPFAPSMTNIGRVENYVATVWPKDVRPGEVPVFRVDQMHIAFRMAWIRPLVHSWSIQGKLSILVQGADNWKEDVLRDFANEIGRQFSLVMAE